MHTLTLKRASNLVVEHRAAAYDDVAAMLEQAARLLPAAGYRPYYLYRQKGTLQNLENIGWSKPGYECLYNIYIMEEVHTILSAGRAAPPSWSRPACATARSSASSISNIPTNTSTALIPFSNARKE